MVNKKVKALQKIPGIGIGTFLVTGDRKNVKLEDGTYTDILLLESNITNAGDGLPYEFRYRGLDLKDYFEIID